MVDIGPECVRSLVSKSARYASTMVGEAVEFGPECLNLVRSMTLDRRLRPRNREPYYSLLDEYSPGERLGASKNPVLLLHGWMQNGSMLTLMRDALRGRSILAYRVHHNPWIDRLDNVDRVARVVDEILDRTGAERIDVIGHSLGGLDARLLALRTGKVEDCITVASPNRGIRIAEMHPLVKLIGVDSASVRQMRVGSSILEVINGPDGFVDGTNYVSIYSPADTLVPSSRSPLHRGINIDIDEMLGLSNIGHGRIIVSNRTLSLMTSIVNSKYRFAERARWGTVLDSSVLA